MKIIKVVFIFFILAGCVQNKNVLKKKDDKISQSDIHDILIKMKAMDNKTDIRNYIDKIKEGGSSSVEYLIEELNSHDSEIQESAAALLGIIGDKQAVEPLIKGLQGGMKRKFIAAWALSKINDSRAIEPLIKALEDEDSEVRKYATRALISFGKNAVNPLIEAIKHRNPHVRAYAIRALGDILDENAIAPIIAVVNDENDEVIISVAVALGKLRDKKAVESLIKLFAHKNKDVRINAAKALGLIGDISVQPMLEKILIEDEDFVVREWVARTLENMTGNRYKYKDAKGNMVEPNNLYK